jgi:hypothetical protein
MQWNPWSRFLWEVAVLVLPPLASLTILADYSAHFSLALVVAALILHLVSTVLYRAPILSLRVMPGHALYSLAGTTKHSFISNFRSGMMLCTCVRRRRACARRGVVWCGVQQWCGGQGQAGSGAAFSCTRRIFRRVPFVVLPIRGG